MGKITKSCSKGTPGGVLDTIIALPSEELSPDMSIGVDLRIIAKSFSIIRNKFNNASATQEKS